MRNGAVEYNPVPSLWTSITVHVGYLLFPLLSVNRINKLIQLFNFILKRVNITGLAYQRDVSVCACLDSAYSTV